MKRPKKLAILPATGLVAGLLFVLVAPGFDFAFALSPADATPSVDVILDKYVQSVGGRTAIESLRSRHTKSFLELVATGDIGSVESYRKAPNKGLSILNYPGWGPLSRAFDGTAGWASDPDSGPRDMGPGELAATKREFDFYRDLHLKDLYPNLTVKGQSKVGSRAVYVVEAKPEGGAAEEFSFDAETGLLLKHDVPIETPDGRTKLEFVFEDYQVVDGVKLPFTIRQSSPDYDFLIKIKEVKHNVEIDDGKFAKPPAQ